MLATTSASARSIASAPSCEAAGTSTATGVYFPGECLAKMGAPAEPVGMSAAAEFEKSASGTREEARARAKKG